MSEEQVRKLRKGKTLGMTSNNNFREVLRMSDPSIENEVSTGTDIASRISKIKETLERIFTADRNW